MSRQIPKFQNRILACLPNKALQALQVHLQSTDLPLRMRLERRNTPVRYAYFIESGIASLVATNGDRSIEVGMIGREGVTGLAVVTGAKCWPQETFMQSSGHGYRIGADDLRRMMDENAALRRCMMFYVHIFMIQAAQTCLANGRSKLEERLARWLLMAQDRLASDELKLTHEFLAYMLGVRRPGVSVALNLLEQRGLILKKRGGITIVDRESLEKSSNGAYGVAEAEFERLLG